MNALVKLSGPNRKVWFLSEDGENITHIKDKQNIYRISVPVQSKDVEISDSSIALSLENDKVYNISNKTTSITLTGSEGFKYCTIHLTTGSAAPSFDIPDDWRSTGADCTELTFTPVANSEYNIAIDTLGDKTTLYVLKIE